MKINYQLFSVIHDLTNKYTIMAEEISHNYYANLQIIKEERDAYSHICCAHSAKDDLDFKREYDNALSHQYRALYDALDWVSLVVRQELDRLLKKFRFRKADIFLKIKKTIKESSDKIVMLRKEKDVIFDSASESDPITPGIRSYCMLIEELNRVYNGILGIN